MLNRLVPAGSPTLNAHHALITTRENGDALQTKLVVTHSMKMIRARVLCIVEPPLPVIIIRNIPAKTAAYLRSEIQKLSPTDTPEERLMAIEVAVHEAVYGGWEM